MLGRRIAPRLYDPDYCLLSGLHKEVATFSATYSHPGNTIVDLGCGTKPYRPLFADCQYIGVDISPSPDVDFVIGPDQKVDLPGDFADLVISTQVVYKIANFDLYLSECFRLLKPNGLLFLSSHGTWTYHPASGGDYYRFTQDGLKMILARNGFNVQSIKPIVGTLAMTTHIRQLLFNSWLKRLNLGGVANILNFFINIRMLAEDFLTPHGSRMASPVMFACIASKHE